VETLPPEEFTPDVLAGATPEGAQTAFEAMEKDRIKAARILMMFGSAEALGWTEIQSKKRTAE
jgi:hypothetical protein